jgi:lipoyl(octanoyl) transferase
VGGRGGQVTYHGPGQVVIYPLIDLRRLGIYVKELVFRIEQSVIQTLATFGVDGRRVKGAPGVYVPWPAGKASGELAGMAKIAALGIKVTGGCSYHGVALNVAMDLTPFARINPCGYAGLPTVDLATLGASVTWQQAADTLAERLAQHLAPRTAPAAAAITA